jgi:hypothetical protein
VDVNNIRRLPEIEKIWEKAQARGRCWGSKKNKNPLGGSQITFFAGDEAAIILENPKGKFQIIEYKQTKGKTQLGDKLKNILKKNNIELTTN